MAIGRIARSEIEGKVIRVSFDHGTGREEREKSSLYRNGLLEVQREKMVIGGQSFSRESYQLQMSEKEKVSYRLSGSHAWSTIRCNGAALSEMDAFQFSQLQRSRDTNAFRVEREFYQVGLREMAAGDIQALGLRSNQQRRTAPPPAYRALKLSSGDLKLPRLRLRTIC